jgi:DNA-binding NarL/FixJ family response regulator
MTNTQQASALRILAFVEQQSLRDMLEMLIETDPELHCTGVFTGPSRFLQQLSYEKPDILLIDADMQGVAVFSLIQFARIHHPEMRIVALLSGDDQIRVEALTEAGCNHCLFKRTTAENFLLSLKKGK